MHTPKKYMHDRIVLLLLSINSFLVLSGMVAILLRLDAARSSGYIAEYRANLGVAAFSPGGLDDILAFIVFMFIVFGINMALSMKLYTRRRDYGLTVLGMGTLLLVLTIIVSNALLVLR